MGNPGDDPYADLLKAFNGRRQDYLRRLTTDEATFNLDPEKNGVALRRGFLAGQGPRPQCSVLDQDVAALAAGNNTTVWTDNPCLRAPVGDPWDGEDVRVAIARLTAFPDPDNFKNNIPVPDEPPAETQTGVTYRALLRLLRQIGLADRHRIRWKIRDLLTLAVDTSLLAPDYNPIPAFDSALIERVVTAMDRDEEPNAGNQTKRDELVRQLAVLVVEGEPAPIGMNDAQDLVVGLYALLPGDVAVSLLQAALSGGRPLSNPTVPASSVSPLPALPLLESERPPNTLLRYVWVALATLKWLGRLHLDHRQVRAAVLGLQHWLDANAGTLPEDTPVDTGKQPFLSELFQSSWVPSPPDFEWPPWSREGIYWWLAVIKSHCVEHCLALAETADFHSTDLLRFLYRFPAPDQRIPDYVRQDVETALVQFKYWWDEPPAKNPKDNSDQAEMTMWSENHQILFAQSQLLAGALFRDRDFPRSGDAGSGTTRTGQDHVDEAIPRVERWLDRRFTFGFSEWNAPGYYNEDLPPLFNLVDFCDTASSSASGDSERQALARIKVKAAMVLDLIVFDFARFTCRGSFGVTAGRAYWEHKAYGWEQSIGNTIEILFGTRGDYTGAEPAAIALATSTYDVPEALLAIGRDRAILDRDDPFTDRSRVSISFDDAPQYGVGFDSEEDVTFWWGLAAYYTDKTLDGTKRVVQAHDNLRLCDPFAPLYAISDGWFKEAMLDLIAAAADAVQAAGGAALVVILPFPLDIVALGFEGKSILDGIVDLFKDVWDYLKVIGKGGPLAGAAKGAATGALVAGAPGAVVGAVGGFVAGLFGGGDDDSKPQIPDSAIQGVLEKLLIAFTQGTVLSTANQVTYSNGDAMLSSVQNHLVGQTAFQKHVWEASLGCEACVWTTMRFMSPDLGSYVDAMERLLQDIGALHLKEALIDLVATPAIQVAGKGDPFGHDGPNYWTGSVALPMIVQHEHAAIICYSIPEFQRSLSGASTHAWFPKAMFDETSAQDAGGGTWFFGRKDHFDATDNTGSGYVALFTAKQASWTNEPGNIWNDKEISTTGGSNIWVCVVGSRQKFGDFDTFRDEVLSAHLNVSGVGSLNSLECSFDVPRASAPAGRSPRLELFYDDRVGRFAGDDLQLDGFPRFENKYVAQTVLTGPPGGGLQPQVEHFGTRNSVGFGSTGYQITHPVTGLVLQHNATAPARSHTTQAEQAQQQAVSRRLQNGSVSPFRRTQTQAKRKRPVGHPQLDLTPIRRRPV